ncbi:hypothetical protein L1987_48274 [Smallanthus sonchifolius]|uniref:Uncharacterized protein n=1 Tax=Smallanthus sonchifolius TaxID=185202 RepID=A0ACB9FS57_9ASTR|nr:hypothetical protein L1987_48274 [Smallanthus sonchifolius]
MCLLKARLTDPKMQVDFESIFPRDNVKNTRFSINFFTSIGLGGITEDLRDANKVNGFGSDVKPSWSLPANSKKKDFMLGQQYPMADDILSVPTEIMRKYLNVDAKSQLFDATQDQMSKYSK